MSMDRRKLVALDWDGVLHSKREFSWRWGDINLGPVREAHARGWAVAIMTANDRLADIGTELARHGIRSFADPNMIHGDWQGGKDGQWVLITGRKVWADVFVDDRAVPYQYGDSLPELFGRLDAALAPHAELAP